ncbi:MAG: TSUP family transporter [Oscillospiraceae bacterium]|nr:TSUP family transporter [Oscillospiraceae bacterium]
MRQSKTTAARYLLYGAAGFATGLLNGLFGSGGGIVAVAFLKKLGLSAKQAHATSVFIILMLSAVGVCCYLPYLELSQSLRYLPGGVAGAVAGAFGLRYIPAKWLRRTFAIFILYAALRLLLRG